MSGLVVKLSAKERILINGAVIENGWAKAQITVKTPNTNILRLKDAIHPKDAITPVTRLCYIAQLALSGDAEHDRASYEILQGIQQLRGALDAEEFQRALDAAEAETSEGNFYASLKILKSLRPLEASVMASKG